MSFLHGLFGSSDKKETMDNTKMVKIRDWTYSVTSDINKFVEVVAETGTGAFLIDTIDLQRLDKAARKEFIKKFGERSIYTQTFWHDSPLICAGCQRQIPPSLCMALQGSNWVGGVTFVATGSTPSMRDEFTKTGACPLCGSLQSYIVVDAIPGDTITQKDIHLIKNYARHLAEELCSIDNKSGTSCHECGKRITKGEELMMGFTTYCETCYENKYRNMIEVLRRKPNILEVSLVRKARAFASREAVE